MIVTLIWAYIYIQSPYLFPVVALPLYALGYDPGLHLGFPMKLYYMHGDLTEGKPPYNTKLLYLELCRWALIYWLEPTRNGLLGYCSNVLLGLILSWGGVPLHIYFMVKSVWFCSCLLGLVLFTPYDVGSQLVLILSCLIDLQMKIQD